MQSKDNWLRRICPFKRKSKARYENKRHGISTCVHLVIRPLRIFQFLVVLLIFVLVIYTIMVADSSLSSVMCILLVVLSGVYVFVLAIDIINQFSGGELHSMAMFIFSLLGTIFFAVAGILILVTYSAPWYILTVASLSLFDFVLFVIEVSLIVAFWKRTCNLCQQCCYSKPAEVLFTKEICDPLCTETVKYDLTTSVSSVRVACEDDDAIADHSHRKVTYGRRRQYVDCPTSARSLAFVNVATVQTECCRTSNIQSQTQREVKEVPIQTVSRCELCNRKMQLFSTPSGTLQQSTAQQSPCSPCPTFLQLFRGAPCCPGCVTGIIQVSQQSQQQQTQRQDQSKQEKEVTKDQTHKLQPVTDEKAYDIVTSEKARLHQVASDQSAPKDPKLTEVPGTVTKLTLASYCVTPKKTHHTSSQTASDDKTAKAIKENAKPEEPKKRPSLLKNDKERDKTTNVKKKPDVLVAEKDKAKVINSGTKRTSIVKSPTKKLPESAEVIPEKPALQEVPETSEESKEKEDVAKPETVEVSIMEPPEKSLESHAERSLESLHQTLAKIEPKKLISPPRQVAQMIDRLQEIKGTKSENPLKLIATESPVATSSTAEAPDRKQTVTISKMVAYESDEKEKEKKESEEGKVEADGAVSDVGKGKKITTSTYNSISISKMKIQSSESELTMTSHELSVPSIENKANEEKAKESVEKSKVEEEKNKKAKKDSEKRKEERALETESVLKPHTGTQTATGEASPSRIKRTYFRKRNKIEPAELTYTDTDIQTFGSNEISPVTEKAEVEKLIAEKGDPIEERLANICPACKRLQAPISKSFQYYSVHRDKRGRLFCEHCANSNTIKVLYKKDALDQKRLKCTACGASLRTKNNYTARNKSDNNCPHCGQTQNRAQSAVSA